MKLSNVTKQFDNRILFQGLSFEINNGILLIKGQNGSGKSTLIRMILGKDRDYSGTIDYQIEDPIISYTGSEGILCFELSMKENYQLLIGKQFNKTANELMNLLSFEPYINKEISQLSGGERQKAELIFALSKNADIYILDEPFSSLDPTSRKNLVHFLNKFKEDHLVLITNHIDLEEKIEANTICSISKEPTVEIISDSIPIGQRQTSKEKQRTLFLALKSYFKGNKLIAVLSTFLTFASMLLFCIASALVNSKSYLENELISLEHDPYEYHQVDFTITDNRKNTSIPIEISSSPHQRYHDFVEGYDLITDPRCDSIKLYSGSGSQIISMTIQGIEYPVTKIDQEEFSSYLIDEYELQNNELEKCIILPMNLFNTLICQDGPYSLNTESNTREYLTTRPSLTLVEGVLLLQSTTKKSNIKVIHSKNPLTFGFTGYPAGTNFSFLIRGSDSEKKVTLTTTIDAVEEITMSEELYKLFFSNSFTKRLSFLLSKEEIKTISQKSDLYGINNIIYAPTNNYSLSPFLFFLSLSLFIINIVYQLIVRKGLKSWKQSLDEVYDNNAVSNRKKERDFLLIECIPFLISIILFLIYLFGLIPLMNFITQWLEDSVLYSDIRYQAIRGTIPFLTFEPISLLLFGIMVLSVIINVIHLHPKKTARYSSKS